MVGQITALYACICSDAAAHMSEEIKVRFNTVICSNNTFLANFTIRTPDVLFPQR